MNQPRPQPFVVNDLAELLNLQRALMDARFFSTGGAREVRGSPLIAGIHGRVVDAIAEHYRSTADHEQLDRLRSWLEWAGRSRERAALVEILSEMRPQWDTWTYEKRFETAKSLVVPFHATDD